MLFSRKKKSEPFNVAALPRLDLLAGPVWVSIGHLANDEHTNAFTSIFEKLMLDNSTLLEGFTVTSVEAKHPVSAPPFLAAPIPISAIMADARAVATSLYFSDNDQVLLHLARSEERRTLSVRFDDPHFTFK